MLLCDGIMRLRGMRMRRFSAFLRLRVKRIMSACVSVADLTVDTAVELDSFFSCSQGGTLRSFSFCSVTMGLSSSFV
jgi:hypothetical protein